MKKKILLVLSLIAIMTVLFAISVSAAEPIETWDVSQNSDGSVIMKLYEDAENGGYYNMTVEGTGYMRWYSVPWDIPWNSYRGAIKSIVVEEGIEDLCDWAFCDFIALESVTLPNSLLMIGFDAFMNCEALANITLPDDLRVIAPTAFANCTSLTSIVIPNSVEQMYGSVFSGCSNLTIYVEAGAQTDGWEENWNNSGCPVVWGYRKASEGLEFELSSDGTYYVVTGGTCTDADVVIPSTYNGKPVKEIGYNAFWSFTDLVSVTIPDSVTIIDEGAFSECTSLTSVVLPGSVTSIGDMAFDFCISLTSIVVDESNEAYMSIDGNLYTKDGKTLVQYATGKTERSFEIPNSVTSVGELAFAYSESLVSVIIPESVTEISRYAFNACRKLTIYCEVQSKPSRWDSNWNVSDSPVVWNYKEALKEDVFTFKGYSVGFAGQISFGYDIDYSAKALYEELTGEALEIGVVFAGYDNLGGKQPLDASGNAIALQVGRVVKADLTDFAYTNYDFVLTNIGEDIRDVKLVVAAYIYDGETVKYVQENGISDTVTGISYNEAQEQID